MDQTQIEPLIRQILESLEGGVTLNWTDLRIYLIVITAAGLGSVLGAYIASYFSKRGEIEAIKKDLDQITLIQEQIKAKISGDLWVNQNIWNLKRETYWEITKVLNQLSSILWDLMREGFLPDKTINKQAQFPSLMEKVSRNLENFTNLTAPFYIVLCADSVQVLEDYRERCKELNKKMAGGSITYSHIESLKEIIDTTYNQLIKIAKQDLKQ